MDSLESDVRADGWRLTAAGFAQCVASIGGTRGPPTTRRERLERLLLDLDLRSVGAAALRHTHKHHAADSAQQQQRQQQEEEDDEGDEENAHPLLRCLPAVLQIAAVVNVGQPKARQGEDREPALRLVRFVDGAGGKCTGVELLRVPGLTCNAAPPGTKVRLLPGVRVADGRLLLTPETCEVLGGNVKTLREAWRASKMGRGKKRELHGTEAADPPPQFEDLGRAPRPLPSPSAIQKQIARGEAKAAAVAGAGAAAAAAVVMVAAADLDAPPGFASPQPPAQPAFDQGDRKPSAAGGSRSAGDGGNRRGRNRDRKGGRGSGRQGGHWQSRQHQEDQPPPPPEFHQSEQRQNDFVHPAEHAPMQPDRIGSSGGGGGASYLAKYDAQVDATGGSPYGSPSRAAPAAAPPTMGGEPIVLRSVPAAHHPAAEPAAGATSGSYAESFTFEAEDGEQQRRERFRSGGRRGRGGGRKSGRGGRGGGGGGRRDRADRGDRGGRGGGGRRRGGRDDDYRGGGDRDRNFDDNDGGDNYGRRGGGRGRRDRRDRGGNRDGDDEGGRPTQNVSLADFLF